MTKHTVSHDGKELDQLMDEEDEFDDLQDQLHQPQQRNAANARERARMRVLSKAFCRLKTTLPWVPPDTKLSKLDTLRLATSYIAHLRAILKLSENDTCDHNIQPVNMNWPFNFHVNWESNTKTSDQNCKTNWSTYSTTYNDRKKYSDNNFELPYDFECNDRYPSNVNKNAKIRQKNSSYCCQVEPEPDHRTANSKYDLNYKSCAYYG